MIELEKRTYRLTGITELLGSQPANEQLRSDYIASKAPSAEFADEEQDMLSLDEKGLTVFLRDVNDKSIVMLDYQIRAFFKGAFQAMGAQLGVKQVRHKVDQFLFVQPRTIPITRDGKKVFDESGILERSLRAETMQGPRTALAASEKIDAPWEITFTVCLLPNAGSRTSNGITFKAIEDALDYGALQGLGQWRSGGYGRFEWTRVEDDKTDYTQAINRRRAAETPEKG